MSLENWQRLKWTLINVGNISIYIIKATESSLKNSIPIILCNLTPWIYAHYIMVYLPHPLYHDYQSCRRIFDHYGVFFCYTFWWHKKFIIVRTFISFLSGQIYSQDKDLLIQNYYPQNLDKNTKTWKSADHEESMTLLLVWHQAG